MNLSQLSLTLAIGFLNSISIIEFCKLKVYAECPRTYLLQVMIILVEIKQCMYWEYHLIVGAKSSEVFLELTSLL